MHGFLHIVSKGEMCITSHNLLRRSMVYLTQYNCGRIFHDSPPPFPPNGPREVVNIFLLFRYYIHLKNQCALEINNEELKYSHQ